MDIICIHCGAVIDRITPEKTIDGDIEYSFFRCPACGGPCKIWKITLSQMGGEVK